MTVARLREMEESREPDPEETIPDLELPTDNDAALSADGTDSDQDD